MRRDFVIVAGIICFLVAGTADAASVSGSVKKADKLYREGKYDEALVNYDRALSIRPDDPVIQYNRGAVLYRKGEFSDAEEAFLKSFATGKEDMEEKAVYNAGNSKYRIGETQEKTDPAAALKNYREAVQYYKRAMELEPNDTDAKYNYEFTLKKIQELEKKMQKQQQEQKQQQQKQQQQRKQQQRQQQQQQRQQEQQKRQQQKRQGQQQQKQQQGEARKEKQEQQREKEKQAAKEEKQEQQKRQQKPERKEEPQPSEASEEQKTEPDEGSAPEAEEAGELSREEAEMLLRYQGEEESRMRAEQKKARRARRPVVLRDW